MPNHNKSKMVPVLLLLSLLTLMPGTVIHAAANTSMETDASEDQLLSMRVMVSKLKQLVVNIKDIDELVHLGLSQADAELMRSVLNAKVSQTRNETISMIGSL